VSAFGKKVEKALSDFVACHGNPSGKVAKIHFLRRRAAGATSLSRLL
jgi:hypothetical protein